MNTFFADALPFINLLLIGIIIGYFFVVRQDRQRDSERWEEIRKWREKEAEPGLVRIVKIEGILLGLNGDNGMRADVRRLIELRSRDASLLQRVDYQVHMLVKTLSEVSPDEETRKRLKALETVPSNFVVGP